MKRMLHDIAQIWLKYLHTYMVGQGGADNGGNKDSYLTQDNKARNIEKQLPCG